ncbi:SDR family oxidoreductase [Paenibacillus xerothermodurans]|uniref:SDR family NAD(P)-dependent oxidoreductase n=1 Tax=Paenibacillus xerothermodurans TaxID=1977292 RepID=A0A2W1P370_PAEXE|nr:SDR family oxidoreductase [Paenibacillus xerothermodurans]PZE21608.1 SDR family NAD(P)-dependent oxidoreductase [Paenibacillus xerothermodurans]
MSNTKHAFPPQHQDRQPGIEANMTPKPDFEKKDYKGSGKLSGKAAIITGGDSGIGRAVAVAFAKEGADVAIMYLNEHVDAEETKRQIQQEGRRCETIAGDIGDERFCGEAVEQVVQAFGRLDVVVNNAAEQYPKKNILDISADQLEQTFRTNVFAMFYMTKAALPHLRPGSTIINTASDSAYQGTADMLDYAATKGAIVSFTRSLALQLIGKNIRVNGVSPGPIWTPFVTATLTEKQVANFGTTTPMKRAGQPEELAPAYVYLACDDSSYMAGQFLHINGGTIVNG